MILFHFYVKFKFIYERLATLEDPRDKGEPLKGKHLKEYWKYRIGSYRIIADINNNNLLIMVVRIGHRRDVYR